MINKRLLIKNLLAYHDESSFFDKKRKINLHHKEGKAKFLKHICALSNSNPKNNSFIIIGVEDETNELIGTDFFDDSKIQNLVNAYLEHPPKILYENIPFAELPKNKVMGLVTIKPKSQTTFFRKNIHTITKNTVYERTGSISMPTNNKVIFNKSNIETVQFIENNSRNSIKNTIDGVLSFMSNNHTDLEKQYKVFRELFVVCWGGIPNIIRGKKYLSRVDIELVNEQVKLFYSAMDFVSIDYNQKELIITEYLPLGINDLTTLYPFEKKIIQFFDNGFYKLTTEWLFEPPKYNQKMLHHIYNHNVHLIKKLNQEGTLSQREQKDLVLLPYMMMISYWNGFESAINQLIEAKHNLRRLENQRAYINFKEIMRILRKMKYDVT